MPPAHFTQNIEELQDRSLRRITKILNPQRGFFSIVLPVARQNDVQNPSFETNTTNWSAAGGAVIARSAAQQYYGVYSLAVTPTTGPNSDGAIYGATTALTYAATTAYAVSCRLLGQAGLTYRLAVMDTSNNVLTQQVITATGRWQWATLIHFEGAGGSRRLLISKYNASGAQVFYVDGVQSEACAAGQVYPTTYIDGDQVGLIANQYPPAYLWLGTAHASASQRSGQTRAGGRVVLFDSLGFRVMAYAGLAMLPYSNIILDNSQTDGAQYQATIAEPRKFGITGLFSEATFPQLQRQRSDMAQAVSRDQTGLQQPLVLKYQAHDCTTPIGDEVSIVCGYDEGLEGDTVSPVRETATLSFTQYLPFVVAGDAGAVLNVQQTIANANRVLYRTPGGVWTAVGTGASGNTTSNPGVYVTVQGRNGIYYIGGDFTSFNGLANSRGIVQFNAQTATVSAMGTGIGTSVSDNVGDMAVAPDGSIWIIGKFPSVGGVANTAGTARWDGSAWQSVATNDIGNNSARMVIGLDGTAYAAGGGGAVYKLVGTTWTSIGAISQTIGAMTVAPNGDIVVSMLALGTVAGDTSAYVHRYSVAAGTWSGLTGLLAAVDGICFDSAGNLYAGTLSAGGLYRYTGAAWQLVLATNGGIINLYAFQNLIYMAGAFTTASGIPVPDSFAVFNGSIATPLDVDLPGAAGSLAFFARAFPDGTLFVGYTNTGSATAASTTTITNAGTVAAPPTITITGPSSGTAKLYSIANVTTGKSLFFNLTINAGETVVLTLNPSNITCISNFQGNVINTILAGSNLADFALILGSNTISVLSTSSTTTVTMQWKTLYASTDDVTP